MGFTNKMEFQFSGEVANQTTGEKSTLTDGKASTITVRRGDTNTIVMWITASHSGERGPIPDPNSTNARLFGLEPGFPYVSTYQYTWTVDVDESGKIYTIGTPKEVVIKEAAYGLNEYIR